MCIFVAALPVWKSARMHMKRVMVKLVLLQVPFSCAQLPFQEGRDPATECKCSALIATCLAVSVVPTSVHKMVTVFDS